MSEHIYVTRSSMPSYEEYCEAIKPLWETHWLTNMGRYHKELEEKLKAFLEVPEVSLTVNGHMALELAIQSFGFTEDSEVITTPFTFVSTTHAIVRNNLKPVFCDIKESDGTIDEKRIEELITPKTVAILPVHVYGHICNVDRIQEIADRYGLKVIYDACHAFGEKYDGKSIAGFGDVSIFSFHATKVFNTIEGGAVCTKSHDIYEKLYNLKNFGIRGEELVVSVGANAKLNEFAAIMGLCNLKNVEKVVEDRKRVSSIYKKRLSGLSGIRLFKEDKKIKYNYGYFPIIVEDSCTITRDELYDKLLDEGVHARKYFYPITADQVCFKNKYKNDSLKNARLLAKKVLLLPIYEGLSDETVEKIIGVITRCLNE